MNQMQAPGVKYSEYPRLYDFCLKHLIFADLKIETDMRLGQISRKYNLKPTQIRDFIQNKFKVTVDLDLNTKIDDVHVEALEKKFENTPVILGSAQPASTSSTEVAATPELVRPATVGELTAAPVAAAAEEVSEPKAEEIKIETENEESTSETSSVTSNNLIDPFKPLPVDPDAELIKAPKIKLEGLKVVGKIELPGKKEVEAAAASGSADTVPDKAEEGAVTENGTSTPQVEATHGDVTEATGKPARNQRNSKPAESEGEEYSIYKDKRGIYHFSRQQKENRKKSLQRIQAGKSEEGKKKAKSRHYQKVVKPLSEEIITKKKKEKEVVREERVKKSTPKPAPKGLWGKFRRWLNGGIE